MNCAGCEHLAVVGGGTTCAFAGCLKTCHVVPHWWDPVRRELTFYRVPMRCPLDEKQHARRRTPAKRTHWTTIKLNEVR